MAPIPASARGFVASAAAARGGSTCARLIRLAGFLALTSCAVVTTNTQGRVGRVAGIVRNEQGDPVAGATVTAENPRATPHRFTAVTSNGGAFVLVGMERGAWIFTASAVGYVPSQVDVLFSRGAPDVTVDLVVKKGAWVSRARRPGLLDGVDLLRLEADLRNADTLAKAKQHDAAIAAYRDILARAPSLTLANLAIGDACREKGDVQCSLDAYHAVLAADQDNEMALVGLGLTELQRGRLEEAYGLASRAAARRRPGRETWCALGDVELALGRADAAQGSYRNASDVSPAWTPPLLKLGAMAAARRDTAAAVALFERVIRLSPGSADAAEAARALEAVRK
jgi:Flp pilus assembly protein TadD